MHTYKDKVNIVTLGCSKNIVDSEKIAIQLQHNDYEVSYDQASIDFDTVIINTCGFIEAAKQESIETIIEWTKEKQVGNVKKVMVTGCLSQRYQQELALEIPEVDAWFGTFDMAHLLKAMQTDYKKELVGSRLLSTPLHYAYLKISEGCNRTCSFCAIPLMRGKHVSKPMDELIIEAEQLVKGGVKEIMLIAQELTYYGLDIYKKRSLHLLLERLCAIKGLRWIRLHYAYPHLFPLEIIETMKHYPTICNYLDMPLQHASDNVLKSMRRQITKQDMHILIDKIRNIISDITLRTTMVVGYPGETEEDFKQLLEFVEHQQFDRLGVFTYSHEEGTTAFELQDDVDALTKQSRYENLMELQQSISYQKNKISTGSKIQVMIDRRESGIYVGRTEADSPEVDNEITLTDAPQLKAGDFVEAIITDAYAYDREATFIKKLS